MDTRRAPAFCLAASGMAVARVGVVLSLPRRAN